MLTYRFWVEVGVVHDLEFRGLPQERKLQMVEYRQSSFRCEVIASLRDRIAALYKLQGRHVGCVYVRLGWLQPREGDRLSGTFTATIACHSLTQLPVFHA